MQAEGGGKLEERRAKVEVVTGKLVQISKEVKGRDAAAGEIEGKTNATCKKPKLCEKKRRISQNRQ